MEMRDMSSSNLHSVGYDPASRVLAVRFRKRIKDREGNPVSMPGALYKYLDVPEQEYSDLMTVNDAVIAAKQEGGGGAAPEMGVTAHFNMRIRGPKDAPIFKFEKVNEED